MSDIIRHETSISNDQQQVSEPEEKTNEISVSHQEYNYNVDREHQDKSKAIRISEISENDVNKNNAQQHNRVSQVIIVKGTDRGSRASIQSQTESILPGDKDGTDAESDSETIVNAKRVSQKEENEQAKSTFKLKREQSVELETKIGGETDKFSKESDPSGEPTDDQKEEKVKHIKYTDGKQEDTINVCDMRNNLPPVSNHDWREHAQVNDLDKQRNHDSDLSVTNTAEKDEKEGVEGIHLGSEKGIIGIFYRDNANYSAANITDPSKKRRISDEVNEGVNEAECETTFGIVEEERREEGKISNDKDLNLNDGSRLLKNRAMHTPVSNTDENVQNDKEDESLRRTRYDCENNGSDMKASPVDKELIQGSEITQVAYPIRSKNQKENNYLENHDNEGSSHSDASGYSWGKKDHRRDETDYISDTHSTKIEQNYPENAKSVDAGIYGVMYPRLNEAAKEKDGEDNAILSQVDSDDSKEHDETKTGYKEEEKEKDANANLEGREESDGIASTSDEEKLIPEQNKLKIIVKKATQPKGSHTTILVSREEEERKRQGNGHNKDKKHMKRGEIKRKYRIDRDEKKRDGSERQSFNYEEGRRIGGAAIAPFTKQYKHKKHIEHVLEEDNYRSDGESKDKNGQYTMRISTAKGLLVDEKIDLWPDSTDIKKTEPDESAVFNPHTGTVRSRSQRGRLFRVPRLKRNKRGRPIGGYYDDPFGPTEWGEEEAELATLDDSTDYNNISGKRTSSSRQYLRVPSARDLKKEDAMTAKTVVFDVPEEGEAMSMDGSELPELRTRGQRDITSAMRRKLRDRLFTRSRERGEAAPNNLPLGCTMKHGWVQMDSNTMETDKRSILGGGRFLLNPLVRVYRQQSPTWSSGTSLSFPGKQAGGPYRRSIGELSLDMERQSVFEQGLQTDRKVLHIADEQKMSTNEHNMRAGHHAFYGTHDYAADEMEDFDENCYLQQLQTDTYDRSSTYLSDDGRLIVREKGCPDLKSSTASSWGHQTGGYGASLSHPSSASIRLQHNHSHIMESDKRLLKHRGDTYKLNSTRPSADYRLRSLLEELFSDKKYLDHLIETTEPKSDTLVITRGIAEHGRDFLMERAYFWEETGPLPPRPALIQYGFRKSRAQTLFCEDTISISSFIPNIRPHTTPVTLTGSVPSEKQSRKYSIQWI